MKMLVEFSKRGDLRFCSHLDLQRLFMRALARAKVPVAFSQGFNRHPNISMAMALGVGQESVCEYLEVDLESEITENDFIINMNAALPKDVRVMDARLVTGKLPALMSVVYAASYEITFEGDVELVKKTGEILKESAIIIDKKTKSKTEPTDIRPMILDAKVQDNRLICVIRSGSVNLKPGDFARLYDENADFSVLRTGLFFLKEDGGLERLINIEEI